MFVDQQDKQVKVIVEPNFRTYDSYDFNQIDQLYFQWIIPLSAPVIKGTDSLFDTPSSMAFLEDELDQIDDLTHVRFEPELPRYCYDTFEYAGRSGDHSFNVELMAETTNYAVIHNSDPDTVLLQLHEQGFDIADNNIPQLQQYAEAGLSFLAVKYHLEAQEVQGAIQYIVYGAPFVFAFEWHDEAIPLIFSSSMYGNLTTWIFADEGYRSTNIAHVLPDYTRLHAPHSIMNTGNFRYYEYANNDYSILTDRQYQEERQRILTGGGLLMEYAGSTDILATLDDTATLRHLIEGYPYLSRFAIRTFDTTPYPTYEPTQNQPDRSNVIDMSNYFDPLMYWGCSSRTALDENTRTNLPDGRQRFDDLRFAIAYPPDWQFSTLTTDEGTIYGFSPETLTRDTVTRAINGDLGQPPMFIFSQYTYITDGYAGPLLTEKNLFTQLNIETWRDQSLRSFAVRYDMRQKEYQQENGVMYGIIASETDWAENDAMYNAMLTYAQSYQYFVSEEWANTLFIHSHPQAETVITLEIPYPDGWIEHMYDDNIVISDESAELRMIPAASITPDLLNHRYNLLEDLSCAQPVQFQSNGREGYVFLTIGYLAEVSVPVGEIQEYESVFSKMIAALPDTCDM